MVLIKALHPKPFVTTMSSRRPKTNAVPKEESDTETIQRKEKDPKRSLAKLQKSSVSFGTILRSKFPLLKYHLQSQSLQSA
jgi:hypothetical protein